MTSELPLVPGAKDAKESSRARAIRNYLIGGLLVWIPILITFWVLRFLSGILDQSLLLQLTPEAMEVFAAAVGDRPGVRAGSVVTQAAMPSLRIVSKCSASISNATERVFASRQSLIRFAKLSASGEPKSSSIFRELGSCPRRRLTSPP